MEEQEAVNKKLKGEVKKMREHEKELESSLQVSNDNLGLSQSSIITE